MIKPDYELRRLRIATSDDELLFGHHNAICMGTCALSALLFHTQNHGHNFLEDSISLREHACICVDPIAGTDGDASKCDRLVLCSNRCLARFDGAGVQRLHANRNLPEVIYVAHAAIDDNALQRACASPLETSSTMKNDCLMST